VHNARSKTGLLRASIVAAVVAALAAVTATAAVGGAKAGGYVSVSQGLGASVLSGYTPFGDTPADTPETVSIYLNANNRNRLQAQVLAGMPSGFLTRGQFAQQYGASPAVIAGIENYLEGFGITARAMSDNLVIQTTGTAGQYDQAFQITQSNFKVSVPSVHGGNHTMVVHGTTEDPKIPSLWGPYILAILGLSNYPTQQSNMAGLADGLKPQSVGKSDLPNQALIPSDFATRYNLSPVQAQGTGAGRTIGIVTLARIKPDVAAGFWSIIGLTGNQASASRINPINVDGGGGPASEAVGSDETNLDVEQSGALAPNANVNVYQAPNTDAGFADAFYQAASDNVADSVSASWGESESVIKFVTALGIEDPNYAATFDQAFLELAAQGQSTFLSSGDSGAYPASRDLGSTDTTAGNPDDSPFVTSAGGTTIPGSFSTHGITFTFPTERAWGWDYLWASPRPAQLGQTEAQYAETHVVGGGGGYSELESMPPYQKAVGAMNASTVEYLTPTGFVQVVPGFDLPTTWDFNANPSVAQVTGTGRATPDLSADADPETGYLLYYTFGDSTDPNSPPSFEQFGGTSFVAPQLNGVASVIDSALGRRVGFWNPAIYKFAIQGNSPFTPLDQSGTQNDNLLYTGTPGAIYNVGTGLGTPDFAKLAQDFANRH
jgi:subtilase family serine protease